MPKLHYIPKKFLKKEGYRNCLGNSQRIQRQEEEVNNTNDATCLGVDSSKNDNQHGGGESLSFSYLNDKKEEKSSIINTTTVGVKRKKSNEGESPDIQTNQNGGSIINGNLNDGTTTASIALLSAGAAAAAAASTASVNLQRRNNQNIIWVRIGATDHPAFELYNPDNPDNDSSSTVWVQYTSNGMSECVSRSQIKHGLQDRKRHRPNYYN
jgi:hypothetical protein